MTSAPFLPLVPGAAKPGANILPARLKVMPAAAPIFQPTTPATAPAQPREESRSKHEAHGDPKITLERQGDTITHIRVECACGQVIELKCGY